MSTHRPDRSARHRPAEHGRAAAVHRGAHAGSRVGGVRGDAAILATLNVVYGIAAVSNSTVLVNDARFVVSGLDAWGWVLLADRRDPGIHRARRVGADCLVRAGWVS